MAELFVSPFCGSDLMDTDLTSVDELFSHRQFDNTQLLDEFNFPNINYFQLSPNNVLLILKHPSKLYFKGSLIIECLSGAVDIHGFTLGSDNSDSYLVVSGYGQSAMCLSSKEGHYVSENELKIELSKRKILKLFENGDRIMCPLSSVLILTKPDGLPILDVFNSIKFQDVQVSKPSGSYPFFQKLEDWFNCVFDFSSGCRIPQKMVYHPSLLELGDALPKLEDPKVMICGGKGLGKSTSLQFLINRMFVKWKAVVVIDFDIGQPEFTVPGCISVVVIKHPLLGPYFTHLCKPIRSVIVGHVNPDMCLTKYSIAVEELHKYCKENKDFLHIPWFINTMGYLKGFGLPLITKISSLFKPSHIVQINSSTEPNLNALPLTPGNISKMLASLVKTSFKLFDQEFQHHWYYTLIPFPAQNVKNTVSVPPRVSREIRVISYMISNGFLSELFIVELSLEGKPEEVINDHKLNAVVGICSPWPGSCCMQCIGYGIILEKRGNTVSLLTPLSKENFVDGFDIVVIEMGFPTASWEEINLYQMHSSIQKGVRLGKKSEFSFNFLF